MKQQEYGISNPLIFVLIFARSWFMFNVIIFNQLVAKGFEKKNIANLIELSKQIKHLLQIVKVENLEQNGEYS